MAKLNKPTDQRMAMIKNQASELLWYGKIETTLERAKSVRSYAEKLITVAIRGLEGGMVVSTKEKLNKKGETVKVEFEQDSPKKLKARRKLMSSLVDLQEPRKEGEKADEYKERTRDIKHPLIEKVFAIAEKYREREITQKAFGGYTRIIRLGQRRGDAAEMAILEVIDLATAEAAPAKGKKA